MVTLAIDEPAGLWGEVVKQVPSLAVLAWIVWTFIRAQREERTAHEQHSERREHAIASIGDQCHQFQERTLAKVEALTNKTNEALSADTRSLDTNTNALERFEQTVTQVALRREGG